MPGDNGGNVNIRVGGALSGQLVAGTGNVTISGGIAGMITEAERAQLSGLFAELRARLPADGDEAAGVLVKLDELEEAIASPEPDLVTIERLQGWFRQFLSG